MVSTNFFVKLLCANTAIISGDLNSAGEMHGYGVFRYANGDVYEGQWRHDKVSYSIIVLLKNISTE